MAYAAAVVSGGLGGWTDICDYLQLPHLSLLPLLSAAHSDDVRISLQKLQENCSL